MCVRRVPCDGILVATQTSAIALTLLLSACAGPKRSAHPPAPKSAARFAAEVAPPAQAPSPPAAPQNPACPMFDPVDAQKHVRNAIEPLMSGDVATARDELRLALCQDPEDAAAKDLLWQLDAKPQEVLGKESFLYVVRREDSLPGIARKFLGDPYRFYLLARYNALEHPAHLHVGQCLKVPGAQIGQWSAPGADRLYRCGLEEMNAGEVRRAHEFFREALEIDPSHVGAREKAREVRARTVEGYRKEAVAAIRSQDLGDALQNCEKILEIDPADADAATLHRQACDMRDQLVAVLYEQAVRAVDQNDRSEALANCDKILELHPGHTEAAALRAKAEAL